MIPGTGTAGAHVRSDRRATLCRVSAGTQLVGFLVAGLAMTAPEFPRLITGWSGGTIYPWWAVVYVVVGAMASIVTLVPRQPPGGPVVPVVLLVMAAQLAGLGLVAVKHWQPSFGMGGGYAGKPEELARLAWIVGLAGLLAAASALIQLVVRRVFPVRGSWWVTLVVGGVGGLVLLVLPYAIGEGDPSLRDLTSLGAFVLLYSGPIGGGVVVAAWLPGRLRPLAIGSCAMAAWLSSLGLITDLSYQKGRPALVGTALLLGCLAFLALVADQSVSAAAGGAGSLDSRGRT